MLRSFFRQKASTFIFFVIFSRYLFFLVNRINYNIHAFYYAWYGAPSEDGEWFHWNHKYLGAIICNDKEEI